MPNVQGVENETVVLLTDDEAVVDAVESTAAALGLGVMRVADVDAALARWASAEVVLVGGDQAGRLASAGPRRRGRLYLVGFDADDLSAWSMPLGAEVIPLPRGLAWLTAVLSADSGLTTPVAAVIGGSGGVGASTCAAGLALAAARRGLGVALVDVDPLGGGVDLLLGAERAPGWRWPRLAGARGEVGDVRQLLPEVEGVTVVSMARGEGAAPPAAESVQAVLSSLARHHDLVVVDAGRSPLAAVRQQVRLAQPGLLVAGCDVRAVAAAAQVRRVLELDSPRLVVRQTPGVRLPPEVVADALGLELWGELPNDPRLMAASEAGEPPLRQRSRWAKAVSALLDRVLAETRDGD